VIPGLEPFDPFPFGVLALVVSSESVFLIIFVLISQGRMARQSERRSHLDLQVGMLSEQELTTILQMLQKLCQHMGVNVDSSKQEVQSFAKQRTYTSWPVNWKTNFRRNDDARHVSIYGGRGDRSSHRTPPTGLMEGVESGKRCSTSRTWLETSSSAAKAWPDLARFT
jgi:Protein of unknown function (DUF1003)